MSLLGAGPQEVLVADIEVLRDVSWLDPDHPWRNSIQHPASDRLSGFGCKRPCVGPDNDQMKQVLFAFKLVAVVTDRSPKVVGLDSDPLQGGF